MRRRRAALPDDEAEALLLRALRDTPTQPLRASDLKRLTGVPKSRVRGILSGVSGVLITHRNGSYWFQTIAPGAPLTTV